MNRVGVIHRVERHVAGPARARARRHVGARHDFAEVFLNALFRGGIFAGQFAQDARKGAPVAREQTASVGGVAGRECGRD